MISYKKKGQNHWVYLDSKRIGEIRPVAGGYRYFPRGGSEGGERYSTVSAVKKTLELS